VGISVGGIGVKCGVGEAVYVGLAITTTPWEKAGVGVILSPPAIGDIAEDVPNVHIANADTLHTSNASMRRGKSNRREADLLMV
jgi:hypothetical protein